MVHALPQGSNLVSVGHVDRPVATVGIEVAPGGGLNGEGRLGHVLCFVPCIVDPRGDPTTTSRTVPTLSHPGGDRWDDEADWRMPFVFSLRQGLDRSMCLHRRDLRSHQ
jgi:hypothetical protein